MARCQYATWAPSGATPHGKLTPISVDWHSDCANGRRPLPHDGLEWHFWISYDGALYQLADTDQIADAQGDGNPYCISVETASNGAATDAWTDAQLASMHLLATWLNEVHGIPLNKCPAWNKPGQGYHSMWGPRGHWNKNGHSCPGPARIKQFDSVFLPSLIPESQEDEDMAVAWKTADNDAVWIVSASGRWWCGGPEALGLLLFNGVVKGKVEVVDQKVLDQIPLNPAPAVVAPATPTSPFTGGKFIVTCQAA